MEGVCWVTGDLSEDLCGWGVVSIYEQCGIVAGN